MDGRFELFTGRDGRFRFRLTTAEGKTLVVSGGYEGIRDAAAAVTAAREIAGTGLIVDRTHERVTHGATPAPAGVASAPRTAVPRPVLWEAWELVPA